MIENFLFEFKSTSVGLYSMQTSDKSIGTTILDRVLKGLSIVNEKVSPCLIEKILLQFEYNSMSVL